MADSELDLITTQIGKETTWGTAVAPTALLVAVESCELTPLMESSPVPESRGNLVPSYEATVDRRHAEASLEGAITFEDLPYWLDSLYGEVSPTGTSPYVWTYNPGTSKPTPRMFTIVRGGPEGVYSVTGAIVNTLEMTFDPNAFAMLSLGFIGKDFQEDALATLSDRTFNVVHGNQATIYIDDFGVAAGTTEYTGVKFTASLSLDANRALKSGLGSQSAAGWRQSQADPAGNQLSISLEMDSTTGLSKDLYDAMIGVTTVPLKKVFRLKFNLDANHDLTIDFAGYSDATPVAFTDEDGVATLEFVFDAMYEATLGDWLEIAVSNEVSALP